MQAAIIRTLAYFDAYDYPLTSTEIWRWLYRPGTPSISLADIIEVLESDVYLQQRLNRVEGFYCFRGREYLIPMRKERNQLIEQQMIIARRFARVFSLIPYVQMIAVCSSLPWGNVKETSDIDFFIVARRGTIWITRLLMVAIVKLLGQRPTAIVKKNKICLSYYVTDHGLDLRTHSIGADDPVMHYHIASLMPLYNVNNTYQNFLLANFWNRANLPYCSDGQATIFEIQHTWWRVVIRWVTDNLFSLLLLPSIEEKIIQWQLHILPSRLKALANLDTRVIINDDTLKLHDQDIRVQLRQRWLDRLHMYEQSNSFPPSKL